MSCVHAKFTFIFYINVFEKKNVLAEDFACMTWFSSLQSVSNIIYNPLSSQEVMHQVIHIKHRYSHR
jgi:hypothetical protein